jgi:hypothetical protein
VFSSSFAGARAHPSAAHSPFLAKLDALLALLRARRTHCTPSPAARCAAATIEPPRPAAPAAAAEEEGARELEEAEGGAMGKQPGSASLTAVSAALVLCGTPPPALNCHAPAAAVAARRRHAPVAIRFF